VPNGGLPHIPRSTNHQYLHLSLLLFGSKPISMNVSRHLAREERRCLAGTPAVQVPARFPTRPQQDAARRRPHQRLSKIRFDLRSVRGKVP
ncbi:MAG: hypothetical protein P1P84_18980, partial [Deferrisomatales bacterium]|nr:hypothetical protein [Deferrisomatales bacterium]